MKVKNKRCIRNLSFKQFKAAKTRNLIAIFAIALTTLLFTSLFTIALSINSSYEEYSFRQAGGNSHGTFKEVDEEKIEALSAHKKIKEYGLRTNVGYITEAPFAKIVAEVSWMDANTAKWSYATPTTGRMPKQGKEVSMDREALKKLGVPAKIGEQVELTYTVGAGTEDAEKRTEIFTLVGFWDYDDLMPVHYINVAEDYMRQVEKEHRKNGKEAFRTDMNVMLASSFRIREVMESIDTDLGYQWENREKDNCVRIGVNWGYSTAQMDSQLDVSTVVGITAFLILVIFTGYLIIYNIFQISVSNDIRFYGLLKTIGTTPKQLKRIVRRQAWYLSAVGIPIGCVFGYGIGAALTPIAMSVTTTKLVKVSHSPLIFVGAVLFSLITVWLSCSRPARKAAKITPVEAVRYTETVSGKRKKRATRGARVKQMAFANLGRNRTKTVLVLISLSLAVVLLNSLVLFTNSFDMEKYLNSFSVSDFLIGTPQYFRFEGEEQKAEIPEDRIEEIRQNIEASLEGAGYSLDGRPVSCWLDEEELRATCFIEEDAKHYLKNAERRGELFSVPMLLEGLDEPLFQKLEVYQGSLEPLFDPSQHAIAISVPVDDYGEAFPYSVELGDTLPVTYEDEWGYYDRRTGELCTADTPEEDIEYRVTKSHDVTYTVCAIVSVPYNMSFRLSMGAGYEAVLSKEALKKDSNMDIHKMFYLMDCPDDAAEAAAEAFLAEYTKGENSELMYESKTLLREQFEDFKNMFLMLGGVLCFIVGLVGVLNFFNAILTGILTRRHEFAMLQSVGMTGKQLKQMLVLEGILYAGGAGLLSLALSLLMNPLLGKVLGGMFWFFSYHFTITPVGIVIPIFLLLGVLLPLLTYRFTAKKSIVERLRETEN